MSTLLKTMLLITAVLIGARHSLGQQELDPSDIVADENPLFASNSIFEFSQPSTFVINAVFPTGVAVKETSEASSSEEPSEEPSELGDINSESSTVPSAVPSEASSEMPSTLAAETETLTTTIYPSLEVPTVTVTVIVSDTWESGNSAQTVTIPGQVQAPNIVTVTQTQTSFISNTVGIPPSISVVSITSTVTETASPTTPPDVTMTTTSTVTTTQTTTETSTLAPSTVVVTMTSTSTDVDVETLSTTVTSYSFVTRTFTLENGVLSYTVGFSEQVYAPTITQTFTQTDVVLQTVTVTV
ncbi:hypothetical protein GGI26_004820 [Coemansia sp. RSA 1358]|uniref:Uncharacterized protein n=1 Tax=Coemansia umbellata TaxID=1424467 RepID=A0ABQ8PLA0_9FUNG|nr:hypothetical protein EDC05_004378 [Coemansia umbellata]KAJ2620658.1 hypothetical protein GGI26_004820 [Coemansia sp. RSA 1358]